MSRQKPADEMQQISGQSPHKYFHMMLNMADDDLDPYQYRVLGHYLRKVGHGGTAQEGIKQTAKICRMSINKLRTTRTDLMKLGYLEVKEPTEAEQAQGIAARIVVVDRWVENINRYAKTETDSTPVSNMTPGSAQPISNMTPPPVSEMTPLEEQLEERVEKSAPAPVAQEPTTSHLPANAINFDAFKTVTPAMNDTIAFMNAQKYMQAFEAAFPANAPVKLPNSHTNRETALFLLKAGYNPDDVTELVKQKIAEGRTAYKFAWLQTDMSEFLQAREKKKPNPPKLTYIVAPPPDDDDYVTETKSA